MKKPLNVLVIEDDIWLSEQFVRTITAAGYTAQTSTNGQVAMEKIDELPPDAIILDVLLTGGTALTLLHELQSYKDTASIPIVLCTNLAAQITLKDVQSYGVKRILDKTTMHPDDIVTALRSVTL